MDLLMDLLLVPPPLRNHPLSCYSNWSIEFQVSTDGISSGSGALIPVPQTHANSIHHLEGAVVILRSGGHWIGLSSDCHGGSFSNAIRSGVLFVQVLVFVNVPVNVPVNLPVNLPVDLPFDLPVDLPADPFSL
jgi:hypothetical protein